MPPFMGAGMGTGIRDVSNLAWKVDLFLETNALKIFLRLIKMKDTCMQNGLLHRQNQLVK